MKVVAGNVVNLLDMKGNVISDKDGFPILYQVISVYRDRLRVGLVTSSGEYIGLCHMKDIIVVNEGPLFKRSDYVEGSVVVWVEGEDVYEGTISTLYESFAKVVDVKKLMPIDYSVRVPYWKIPEGRKSYPDETDIQDNDIGDDLK